eukprot:352428-Chlamydomonas_euryale.AAC.3
MHAQATRSSLKGPCTSQHGRPAMLTLCCAPGSRSHDMGGAPSSRRHASWMITPSIMHHPEAS